MLQATLRSARIGEVIAMDVEPGVLHIREYKGHSNGLEGQARQPVIDSPPGPGA